MPIPLPDPYVPPEPEMKTTAADYCIRINEPGNHAWWSCNTDHGAGWTTALSDKNWFKWDKLLEQLGTLRELGILNQITILSKLGDAEPPEPEKPERRLPIWVSVGVKGNILGERHSAMHATKAMAQTRAMEINGEFAEYRHFLPGDPTPEAVQDVAYQLRHESQKYMAGNNICVLSKWLVRLADKLEGK